VLPHVRRAAEHVGPMFGVSTILGWRATAVDMRGHPAGLALDFMCGRAAGRRLNAYLLANAGALGVAYTIHEQTYFVPGEAPEPMADRGSATANHLDHVHANFRALGGDGTEPDAGAGVESPASAAADLGGWATGAAALGLKLAAIGAGLVLVVAGARQTVHPTGKRNL
jgi:hypothetical protein